MPTIQHRVQDAIDQLVSSGAEQGVQVAVYSRGDLVVDAVAGLADPTTGRPVTSDTPFHVTSTGKGLTAAVVHVLAERGVLGYDTAIVDLWPEFGAHGKEGATVRHALTHAVGVPALPAGTTPEDLCDWPGTCALIAGATPWWKPGTATGYHAQTFGYLLGEVVRRATGRPVSEVMREHVAHPLGIEDELYFGVPRSELGRVARLEEAGDVVELSAEALAALAEQVPFFRVVDGWTAAPPAVLPGAAFCNRPDVLTADIPAGAVLSARALARVYAAMMSEVDGVRLVGADRLAEVTATAVSGTDEVLDVATTRGLGYDLGFPGPLDRPTLFGMAGSGGTAAYADTATATVIALAKNRVTAGDYRSYHHVSSIVVDALELG